MINQHQMLHGRVNLKMTISIDTAISHIRREPIFLEGRFPMLMPAQARLYGLEEGQVINAVIKQSGINVTLNWGSMRLLMPNASALEVGKSYELVVTLLGNGMFALKPVLTEKNKALSQPPSVAVLTSSDQTNSELILSPQAQAKPTHLSLGEAFATALHLDTDVVRLLAHNPILPEFLKLLHALGKGKWPSVDDTDANNLNHSNDSDSNIVSLMQPWVNLVSSQGHVSPQSIRQALLMSGLATELKLKNRSTDLDGDLKVILRQLLNNNLDTDTNISSVVTQGIDNIERHQLDALQAQIQGYVNLQFAFYLGNAGPWVLHFFRNKTDDSRAKIPFCVDVHSRHSGLGPLWLRSLLGSNDEISMKMWAQRPEIAALARENRSSLQHQLQESGLFLKSFQVIEGIDPYELDLNPMNPGETA